MSNPFSAKPDGSASVPKDAPPQKISNPPVQKSEPAKKVAASIRSDGSAPVVAPALKRNPEANEGNNPLPVAPSQSTREAEEKEVVHPDPVSHHATPPPLGMDEVSCRTCRFFESKGESRCIAKEGECRCKAPIPGEGRVAQWPKVPWQSWCGEWELGVSDEEMIRMARVVADRMNDNVRVQFTPPSEQG